MFKHVILIIFSEGKATTFTDNKKLSISWCFETLKLLLFSSIFFYFVMQQFEEKLFLLEEQFDVS